MLTATLLNAVAETLRLARHVTPPKLQLRRAMAVAWLADRALSARLESKRKRAATAFAAELRRGRF